MPDIISVDWSYPTSPNADRFRFPRGCWTVSKKANRVTVPEAVKGFQFKTDALEFAESLRSVEIQTLLENASSALPE